MIVASIATYHKAFPITTYATVGIYMGKLPEYAHRIKENTAAIISSWDVTRICPS